MAGSRLRHSGRWLDNDKARPIVFWSLARELLALYEVVDRFGDVGGVVADALDVLGAEQEMRAERYAPRVFHHVCQELAEQRVVHGVNGSVATPDSKRRLQVVPGKGVKHVMELGEREVAHVLDPN